MTTSIHLCLGPCVGLVALLSLLRSSCFGDDFHSCVADGPAIAIVVSVLSLRKTLGELQKLVDSLYDSCCKWGMKIRIKKTKFLSIGYEQARILLDGSVLENVTEFTYLGSIISQDGGCIAEIDARLSKAIRVFGSWKKRVFTNRQFQSPHTRAPARARTPQQAVITVFVRLTHINTVLLKVRKLLHPF